MNIRSTVTLMACGVALMTFGTAVADSIVKPFTFTPNTLAKPNEVNENFDTLYDQVNKVGAEITIDSANKRVGIGSVTPGYSLDVGGDINFSGSLYQNGTLFSGGGSPDWTASGLDIYYDSGNVGIGTASPGTALEVNGTVTATTFVGDGTGITGIVVTESDPNVNALGKSSLACTSGQIAKWNGAGWNCADDKDTDTNTHLSESQVDTFVSNNGYLTSYSETDPNVNTLGKATLACTTGQIVKWNGAAWSCASDGGTGAFVDSGTSASYMSGNVGIGIAAPARKLHISDAMRLEPLAEAPTLPADGDFYFDSSNALCVYVGNSWSKIAGSGSCYDPFVSKLPGTGQTTSYSTIFGENNDYTINPPSYTLNGDGTTTDNVTDLMWQSSVDVSTFNWYEANGTADATYNPSGVTDVCGNLGLAGYADWRLPTITELLLISNYEFADPAIDQTFFPGENASGIFWTSTFLTGSSTVWVYHSAGLAGSSPPSYDFMSVRCVRGAELPTGDFIDNENGTVTDLDTSLVWQQEAPSGQIVWEAALSYCEGLELAGEQNWRLPNVKELNSIVDRTMSWPAIPQPPFIGAIATFYWTSTTYANNSSRAWHIGFRDGAFGTSYTKVEDVPSVRCVSGGNTRESECINGGGYWWSDSSCQGVPQSETVISAGGRLWMDRNLGASQVATSFTDSAAYGDLYQWGRGADGHEKRTSITISTKSSISIPEHGDFILGNSWMTETNVYLWSGVAGTNNPCPAGFRVPTSAEYGTEFNSWSTPDAAGAFASPLKLVMAGMRSEIDGAVNDTDTTAYLWSSGFVYQNKAVVQSWTTSTGPTSDMYNAAGGFSVRCIKD